MNGPSFTTSTTPPYAGFPPSLGTGLRVMIHSSANFLVAVTLARVIKAVINNAARTIMAAWLLKLAITAAISAICAVITRTVSHYPAQTSYSA